MQDRADKRKHHFIYKTTNVVTNKFYIGMHSTNNLEDGYIGSGKKLWNSINKYGKENHKCEILEFVEDRKSLSKREAEIVNEEFLLDPLCLNLKVGGHGGGKFQNPEHQLKCSLAGSNAFKEKLKNDEQFKLEFSLQVSKRSKDRYKNGTLNIVNDRSKAWNENNRHSEKSKEKMKLSQQNVDRSGNKNPMFGRKLAWISKNGIVKRIELSELENHLSDGWNRGIIRIIGV